MAIEVSQWQNDRRDALEMIRRYTEKPFFVLDTETTGFERDDEIVSIAILSHDGTVVIDTLVKPVKPINELGSAFERHHITNEMVKDAPTFAELWPKIADNLGDGCVFIYNADYDTRMINQSYKAHHHDAVVWDDLAKQPMFVDLMVPYAAVIGEWNNYFGNYKWQKLPGTRHNAADDCRAVLELLKQLNALER